MDNSRIIVHVEHCSVQYDKVFESLYLSLGPQFMSRYEATRSRAKEGPVGGGPAKEDQDGGGQ